MIGQILEAPGRPSLQVVAVDNGAWLVTTLNQFSQPRRLSEDEALAYNFAAPVPAPVSYAEGWQRLGRAYEGRD